MSPIEMNADPLRIRLLLKNLIDNACHYSADGGQPIDICLRQEGSSALIEVSDHGIGIDPGEIPRLTKAFYRPDSARQRRTGGYGLGLYLCRLIIDAHRGKLLIESEPGSGTKVIVRLPLDNS